MFPKKEIGYHSEEMEYNTRKSIENLASAKWLKQSNFKFGFFELYYDFLRHFANLNYILKPQMADGIRTGTSIVPKQMLEIRA